jgi:integrase
VCASSNLAGGAEKRPVQRQFSILSEIENLPHPYGIPAIHSWPVRCGRRHQGVGAPGVRRQGCSHRKAKADQSRVHRAATRAGSREAAKQLAALVAEVERGGHGGTSTFGTLLDEWTAHGERMGRSPKTLYEYRRKIDKRIRPALGAKGLDKLTAHDLDRFYAAQLATGLGERSVHHLHRMISAALRQGRKWGMVKNVADDATPPTPQKTELSVPSPAQVSALIREAARPTSRSPELASVITLAVLTGMRRGELCGLRWSDVDWKGSAVTVRQSVWQTSEGIGTKAPKTHQTRRLLLGEHAMALLAGRLDRAKAEAKMAKVKLPADGYIFSPDVDAASPTRPDLVTQAFTRLCRRMEAPALAHLRETKPRATRVNLVPADRWDYRLHDLRHYTATQLFAAGLNPKTVADRLGHADPSITLRVYTANTDAQAQEAADTLEAGLEFAALGPR